MCQSIFKDKVKIKESKEVIKRKNKDGINENGLRDLESK
ncbi:hypothetical protein T4D_12425 [Trichinella pseudospiralis]|uniref:Uncharacterized protein n=1 Tax=Trichinella pseudospiralis TaxID=6337 RepID=A0A0V1DSX8_TRIPS|nr:hypothetical protein T4D_12425 [Trichinella pseudospiralis]